MMFLYWFWIWQRLLKFGSFSGSMMGLKCCSSVQFLLKIRSDQFRIHDTIVCSGTMLWLFSLAWDAVLLTLKVGFICRSVVIDSTDLGETTELLFQELCLSTLNLSPTQNTCLLPIAIKLACLSNILWRNPKLQRAVTNIETWTGWLSMTNWVCCPPEQSGAYFSLNLPLEALAQGKDPFWLNMKCGLGALNSVNLS